MTREQILKEIEKHLNSVDEEILYYSYSINLTLKNDKEEYLRDGITISKNFSTGWQCYPKATYC